MNATPAELIALANARFMASFASGDKESFVRLYTDDSILMLQTSNLLQGTLIFASTGERPYF